MKPLTDQQKKWAWIVGAVLLAIPLCTDFDQHGASRLFISCLRRDSQAITSGSCTGATLPASIARGDCGHKVWRDLGG
jgi:hypothetical protein